MKLKKSLALILAFCMVLSTMSFNVFAANEPTDAAKIGDTHYATLQAAIDAARNDDVIILEKDCADDVTVVQSPDVVFTIDGNNNKMSGAITINGKSAAYATAGLTIKNVNFDATSITKDASINFGVSGDNNTRYISNVTVTGCTFTGEGDAKVGIKSYTGGDKNITIENCTATGMHSLVQEKNVAGLTVLRCTVVGKNGISVGNSTVATISGCNLTCTGYGVRADADAVGAHTLTVNSSSIEAKYPVIVRKAKIDDYNLTIGAGCEFTSTSGYDIAITTGDDGVEPDALVKPDVEFDLSIDKTVEASVFSNYVASVNGVSYDNLQDAIKAAAPSGTVTLLDDVTVDEWIMFSERLSIGNGNIITLVIDGLTINGNGKTLTVKSIESAGNGNRLFYDATNLNINNLTIKYIDAAANQGGIGLKSGTLKNVTFIGGGNGVLPGDGNITIEGCTFKTNGAAIYYEDPRDNLVVNNNTFELADNVNAILLRGNGKFTNNNIISGRTVNVVSGSPVVSGNNFNDVRLKVYNAATATIEDNIINNLVFDDETSVQSSFAGNILSDDARELLAAFNFETVAKIGNAEYYTLQAAFEAVEDGQTIKLSKDIVIDENSRYNNGGWFEGAYYEGDESFVIDLNGHTITQNGAVNDYLLLFKNNGSKENEIAIKNGTIDAGTTAYCAICTSTTSSQKLTINTENVNIIGNNNYGSVMKIRGGAVLNVNDGTVIIGKDSYLGIENWNATVNIYEGAEIYMNGTTSYNGCLVGVGGNGTINVYGGYGKGVKGAFIAMTSGGIINIYGGEWIADTDGTNVAGNDSVLIAQNDKNTYPDANNSVVNVAGGRFIGSYNCYGNAVGDAQINITAGMFDQDPSAYVADKREAVKLGDDEGYTHRYIVADKKASAIKVELAETDTAGLYDIILVSSDGNPIHEFVAAEFVFKNESTTVGGSTMQYEVLGLTEGNVAKTVVEHASKDEFNNEQYTIHVPNGAKRLTSAMGFIGETEFVNMLKIGQVKFIGQGTINFSVASGKVATTWQETNLGRYYENADAIDAGDNLLLEGATIKGGSVADITRDVVINVTYNHPLVTDKWNNEQITVTLKDAYGEVIVSDDISDGYAAFNDIRIGRITVTLEAPGFRKFVYETTLDEDDDDTVVLSFWNDVKKDNHKLSIEKDATAVAHNFVVGDIVMDYIVDKYDLAAVTSYYGMYNIKNNAKYIKYDLNRDGDIDIRDVQYVLHTMGN